MDKNTLSNYGWIVICVIVLGLMLALASPLGTTIQEGIADTVNTLDEKAGNAVLNEGETFLTIDGAPSVVNVGDKVRLPSVDGDGITVYKTTNGKIYYPGDEITVPNDVVSLSTSSLNLVMDASSYKVRTDATNGIYGIRWYTNLNTELINLLKSNGATVTLGTLITPVDLLGTDDLTLDWSGAKVNVTFLSDDFFTEGSFTGMVGTMANIRDANANRNFVGRGYAQITYTDSSGNSVTKTEYANYANGDISKNSVNIANLSRLLKADTEAYNACSDTIKERVDHYADLYEAS